MKININCPAYGVAVLFQLVVSNAPISCGARTTFRLARTAFFYWRTIRLCYAYVTNVTAHESGQFAHGEIKLEGTLVVRRHCFRFLGL